MSTPLTVSPVIVTCLFVLTGCAAPIKALMAQPESATTPSPIAAPAADHELRLALQQRAKAMLAAREANPVREPAAVNGKAERATGKSPAIAAMLARARVSPAQPVSPQQPVSPPTPKSAGQPPGPLAMAFRVKDETRLSQSSSLPDDRQRLIRFAGKTTSLDSAGNSALADLARQTNLEPGHVLVITGGLAGEGQAWERLQRASERIAAVALHVPPPLTVERRFEPDLDGQILRLEIRRERR